MDEVLLLGVNTETAERQYSDGWLSGEGNAIRSMQAGSVMGDFWYWIGFLDTCPTEASIISPGRCLINPR